MNEFIAQLQQRSSAPRLTEPAPSAEQVKIMLQTASRAPDHARLRPWRFLTIAGDSRERLGALFVSALRLRNPDAVDAAIEKAARAPLRAPLVIAAIASITEHPKVPPVEQRLAVGCSAYTVLLAAEALGFAGVWRTGDASFDRNVMQGLGLAESEEIIGFLYIGTRVGDERQVPLQDYAEFVSAW